MWRVFQAQRLRQDVDTAALPRHERHLHIEHHHGQDDDHHDTDYHHWRNKYDNAVADHESHKGCDDTMLYYDDLEAEVDELATVRSDLDGELTSYLNEEKSDLKRHIDEKQQNYIEDLDDNFLRSQELMMYLKESVQWASTKRSRHDQVSPP